MPLNIFEGHNNFVYLGLCTILEILRLCMRFKTTDIPLVLHQWNSVCSKTMHDVRNVMPPVLDWWFLTSIKYLNGLTIKMAPQELMGEMINIAQEKAEREERRKEQQMQQAVLRKLRAFHQELYRLEIEIKDLTEKEKKLRSEGRKILAGITRWRINKKAQRAEKLRSVMPSRKP